MEDYYFTLKRFARKPTYTIGRISSGGIYLCDSLEPQDRDFNHDGDLSDPGEGKNDDATALPIGTYEMVLTDSPHFGFEVPILVGTAEKGFTAVEIHPGNYVRDTHACILPGMNTIVAEVHESTKYFKLIVSTMQEMKKQGRKIFITIT
jgi:hypothetical protein